MATTTEGKIAELLMTRVASLGVGLPVAWPNVNFPGKIAMGQELPMPDRYLRVQHVPNVVERQHINSDGQHRYMGIIQVSVHWETNKGESDPREVAGLVVAHFPCDLILRDGDLSVRIMKRPAAVDLLDGYDDIQIPVSIEYEAYA